MPLTTLDLRTALIVIDLQQGLLTPDLEVPLRGAARKARELADAFRARQLPIVWVTVAGGAPGRTEIPRRSRVFSPEALELLPELGAQASDLRVSKRTWGAFLHTDLERQLRDLGITGVVLAGVSTSMGVESTARQAYELGFNVTLATDAMLDLNSDSHRHSTERVFPKLGETGDVAQVLEVLARTHPLAARP